MFDEIIFRQIRRQKDQSLQVFFCDLIQGISKNSLFAIFFEIATSYNSLDYRELQHRIFKVTSKN